MKEVCRIFDRVIIALSLSVILVYGILELI